MARGLHKGERRDDLVARTTFYVGFRLSRGRSASASRSGRSTRSRRTSPTTERAAFAISPSVRLLLGRVEPAFSLLFPIATPLRGEAASYYAARFNVGFAFDAGRRRD